jgi:hypothetical protein
MNEIHFTSKIFIKIKLKNVKLASNLNEKISIARRKFKKNSI